MEVDSVSLLQNMQTDFIPSIYFIIKEIIPLIKENRIFAIDLTNGPTHPRGVIEITRKTMDQLFIQDREYEALFKRIEELNPYDNQDPFFTVLKHSGICSIDILCYDVYFVVLGLEDSILKLYENILTYTDKTWPR